MLSYFCEISHLVFKTSNMNINALSIIVLYMYLYIYFTK